MNAISQTRESSSMVGGRIGRNKLAPNRQNTEKEKKFNNKYQVKYIYLMIQWDSVGNEIHVNEHFC